ncbi:MAG: hypothetical protein KGP27_10820 [Hyphomicrobiales bacterium]|nr:hypothetical protein [Hyphomicrobiales bacterium]
MATRDPNGIATAQVGAAAAPRTMIWVIRRALIGLALIATFAIVSALLLHSGIDPAAEAKNAIAGEE